MLCRVRVRLWLCSLSGYLGERVLFMCYQSVGGGETSPYRDLNRPDSAANLSNACIPAAVLRRCLMDLALRPSFLDMATLV